MNAQRAEISVLFPVLNVAGTLGDQLDALAAQQADVAGNVIMADNGSWNSTGTLVEHPAEGSTIPLHTVDASPRRGAACARNRGAEDAQGEIVVFCDADGRVGEGWINVAFRAAQRRDGASGVLGELRDSFKPEASRLGHGTFTWARTGGKWPAERLLFEYAAQLTMPLAWRRLVEPAEDRRQKTVLDTWREKAR